MADVAFVFHWPPSVMDAMSISELMQWHARAVIRHNPPKDT
jgi:hypothetical protein